jgi:hypothetical protein
MNWIKQLLFTAIGLSITQTLLAQQHYNVWFNSTLHIPINNKINIDHEFQHRRQNGLNNTNIFDKNLMFNYRIWGHYQLNEKIKFSVSPFAYFSHYNIIQKEGDETIQPNNEFRFSIALKFQQKILKNLNLVERTAIEYRIFNNKHTDIVRLRNQIGLHYGFTKKLKLFVFDELLINVNCTSKITNFDHNRLGVYLEYQLFPHLQLDMGYMHTTPLPIAHTTKPKVSNTILKLTYQFQKS